MRGFPFCLALQIYIFITFYNLTRERFKSKVNNAYTNHLALEIS